MLNLLSDPLVRIEKDDGATVLASLPETLALLMNDEVLAFPALRPHQRHSWHAFLVQLAAMAIHQAGVSEPPADAAEWAGLIRGLTPEFPDDEPWHLVVDDITKPAFMQVPASSSDKLQEYKSTVGTPDGLDILVTSKNHDVKSSIASSSDVDDWIFALISLQTSEGFSGAGNYGISRMNGGLGCRPAFSITPTTRPGIHFRRDVSALMECRDRLLDDYPLRDGGARLLWTHSWDGTKVESFALRDLDPFYIEICRRIRMRAVRGDSLHAIRATSKSARIDSKALNGRTGDPWTPINGKEGKSLTLAGGGFTYKRTADYLTPGDWQPPLLSKPTAAESASPKDMQLVARGVVRGQGKTEGYHERIIPLKAKTIGAFGRPRGVEELGDIARDRINQVRTVQRILRHAVWTFAAGGKMEGVADEHRDRANPWANKLDETVDVSFFEDLQDEFVQGDQDERVRIRNQWLLGVVNQARELLRQAEDALPCPAIQRYRARVRAESVFEGRIRGNNGLPWLFEPRGDEH